VKKSIYLGLGILILLLGYRVFFTSLSGKKGAIAAQTIICFGDSLTFGTGAGKDMDYPSQLSAMIGRPVINAGVPGDTTASAMQRLEQDVLFQAPDLVLITLGGNDLKNGVAKDRAFKNLSLIVNAIQNTGARVILGGVKFPIRDRGYGRAYQELADETGAILIPNIFEGIMGNRQLMSDPIHPNEAGYKIIAERFYEAIINPP
jgi:lysophospholipase L1-like esterase